MLPERQTSGFQRSQLVPDLFTPSVVYMTTDVMPSSRLARRLTEPRAGRRVARQPIEGRYRGDVS